jgi:hypothetical protein
MRRKVWEWAGEPDFSGARASRVADVEVDAFDRHLAATRPHIAQRHGRRGPTASPTTQLPGARSSAAASSQVRRWGRGGWGGLWMGVHRPAKRCGVQPCESALEKRAGCSTLFRLTRSSVIIMIRSSQGASSAKGDSPYASVASKRAAADAPPQAPHRPPGSGACGSPPSSRPPRRGRGVPPAGAPPRASPRARVDTGRRAAARVCLHARARACARKHEGAPHRGRRAAISLARTERVSSLALWRCSPRSPPPSVCRCLWPLFLVPLR